jgi:hypothetical protein
VSRPDVPSHLLALLLTSVGSGRGCVSGAQIQNVRDAISTGDDEYRWDAIDGYDELE